MSRNKVKIKFECYEDEPIVQQAKSLNPAKLKIVKMKPTAMSAEEFSDIMEKSNLTQEVYAEELCISQGYISLLRNGYPISEDIAQSAKDILIKYTKPKRKEIK
ncbi:MAG: hypothetical protein FD167_1962 [bacterium]|nr:MAG: hypothetical protein FD167_1962 [bacterium]